MRGKLPGMRDDGPNLLFDGNARGTSALGEARGITAQNFVRADMNQKRRKAGEIGIQRGGERIARIGVAKIVARRRRNIQAVEYRSEERRVGKECRNGR